MLIAAIAWPSFQRPCHSRKAGLCRKLKDKCLALHQRYYPWMLDLRLINLEQIIKEQKDKEKDNDAACVLVHDDYNTRLAQDYYANIDRDLASFPDTSSTKAVFNMDLSIESPNDFPTTISFSTDFTSFLLPYRLHTSWPLITALSYQAIRPCSALASPRTSRDLEIEFSTFHLWRLKTMHDPKTRFQPKPTKIFYKRRFECGLPNMINLGHMEFENPDGGAPKSIVEDSDFEDSWESRYVVEKSSGNWSSGPSSSDSTTQETSRNKAVNRTTSHTHASSHSSNPHSLHDTFPLDLGANFSHLDMEAPMIETSTNLLHPRACTLSTHAPSTLASASPLSPDPLGSCVSTPSNSSNNGDDYILVQKEFRDILFPDLDDIDDLHDLEDHLNSSISDSTPSPSQRPEQQAQLVCEVLKTPAIVVAVMVILIYSGACMVKWLLVG